MKNWGQERGKAAWDRLPGWLTVILFASIIFTGVALGAANYEAPSEKRASEVLPPNLRSGTHFRVQDRVAADGYMLRFTVNSDYGTFPVTGEYGLRKLIKEIQAIASLKKTSKGEAFVQGARGKAQETVEFGANLVVNPGETLASVPEGVAKLFDNLGTGLQKPREPRRDTVAAQLLNVSDAKRKIAYDLGVDVYSSNRVLQNELDGLSKAQALGSLGVSAAIPYGGGTLVGISRMSQTAGEVNRLLRDESPSGLRNVNERKLQAMGVDRSLTERFLNSTQLSPRHKTVIVASLEKLSGARGRDVFINFALQATDEASANFMQNMAEILAAYQQTVSPIQEITAPGIILARAANGTVLIPFPLDYGVWTVRAERVVKNTLAGYKTPSGNPARFELWVTGAVSPLARRQLEAQGIKVVENVDRRIGMMD
ncbi:MAG: hypothetical protein ABSA09_02355 [Desulfobaccales bacterium]|jgi:hypothetical protein